MLVAVAWMYVVLMMALAEAMSSQGSVLGAVITFVLYGVLPLSIVLYIMGTPGRRKARRAREAKQAACEDRAVLLPESADPDGGGHAAGDAVAAKREEA
ncbi:MAG TPA: hypothetical protein VGQ23_21060 [Burkholderiaceae bacterium]|jgi:hypothetical protein|nr:hypothetical protein [Burkholderiaceae bacterium]